MGFLQRRDDNDRDGLGLPSRLNLPNDLRRVRDREVGRSAVRGDVVVSDMANIARAGQVGIGLQRGVNRIAEMAAVEAPHDRARTDALADACAVLMAQKLGELGGTL